MPLGFRPGSDMMKSYKETLKSGKHRTSGKEAHESVLEGEAMSFEKMSEEEIAQRQRILAVFEKEQRQKKVLSIIVGGFLMTLMEIGIAYLSKVFS